MSGYPRNARKTQGERIVAGLLRQLSDDYFWVTEPMIHTPLGSKRPDFIVVAKNLGVAIIEVKDWREILEASQQDITIRRADGEILILPNPAQTARDYAIDLARVFEQHKALLSPGFGRARLSFPWQEVVVLTNISAYTVRHLERNYIFPEGVVLGAEALVDAAVFEEALTSLPWRFALKGPLNNDTLAVIRSVIDPRIIIRTDEAAPTGIETPLQSLLIREEPKIVEPPPAPVVETRPKVAPVNDDTLPAPLRPLVDDLAVRLVRGVAGAGKTLVLTRRAQFLHEHFPQYRVLVLSFNTDLADALKRKLPLTNITVTGFHKLCSQILGQTWRSPVEIGGWLNRHLKPYIEEQGLTVDFVAEEIRWRKDVGLFDNDAYLSAARTGRGQGLARARREIINAIFDYYRQAQHGVFNDWEDVPYLAYEALTQTPDHPLREAFHVVLVDEAQDFAPSWIRVVKAVMKPQGTMLVCDDPTQSLFKYFSWKEKGLQVSGRTSVLRIPFRCTREITRAAYSLVEADPILSTEEDLLPPRLNIAELRSGDRPELRQCSTWAEEVGYVEQGVIALVESGVPWQEIAVLCHDNRDLASFQHLTKRGVYVRGYGKMKGLEFQAVFLPRLNSVFDDAGQDTDATLISRHRRRVYVGMTRARHWLALSYHGALPAALEPLLPHVNFVGRE